VADERFNRAPESDDTDTEDESAPLLGTSSAVPTVPSNGDGEEAFVQQNQQNDEQSVMKNILYIFLLFFKTVDV
jgi:hypothetical protein